MQNNFKSLLVFLVFFISSLVQAEGPSEQLSGHQLIECPNQPNCVSTQSQNPDHAIKALNFTKPSSEVLEIIKAEILSLERTTLAKQADGYLHFEFRSRIFRFIDDVEFKVDSTSGTIHFRSASRMGYSDLGVNRDRFELIKKLLVGKL